MACELSGLNGKLPAGCKVKKVKELLHVVDPVRKWRRRLLWFLVLCAVFVAALWLLLSANKGASGRREECMDSCEEKVQLLMQYFNVSAEKLCGLASFYSKFDQMPSPEHAKVYGLEMPIADGIVCAPRVLQSMKRESKLQEMVVAEDLESDGQCPMQEQHASVKLQPLLQDKLVTVKSQLTIPSTCQRCAKDFLQSSETKPCEEDHCGILNLSFVKVCWCILGGMMACCMFSCFIMTFRQTEKLEAAPIEPVPLKRQQLLQMKQQQLTQSPPKSAGKWRKKFLVLFVFAGIVFSIWLFRYFNGQHVMSIEETLANMCDERARMLQDQFNVSMNHVQALAILVSTFHHGKYPSVVDQITFSRYTERTAFERPLTSGVAYALKVLHSDREQFEKQQGWTIKKMESEDQSLVQHCVAEELDPAPVRDEYAPVIFSQETVSHIISIDMMSGQEDRENILRARASGKGVLTSPFKLLKSNHLGVVLTFAVYNADLPLNTPEQRIEAAVGYLGASYDIPSLVEKLLQQLASKQTIVVHVYDTTNTSSPILMYESDIPDTDLLHISNLDFGDPMRKHEMHCRFKQTPPLPWTAIMASIGSLTITLLVGYIFHAALKRIAKVEADCRQMMELKVRAEAADVAKSQFLATVSHEIRTPMNGVLGMLKMLMDTDLDMNQMDYAWTAHTSGKELISLINDVLDQAKIESGRLELETVPFNLPSVLDSVLSLFSVKANEKGIELAVYVSNQVPEVVIGDPGRFRQIIQNLVGNSIKFTRENEGHIFVTVHLAEEVINQVDAGDVVLKEGLSSMDKSSNKQCATLSGFPVVSRWKSWENFKRLNNIDTNNESKMVRVLVTVEDTGVGISQEAQGRIFTPFVQGDSSTSRTYGGTGIGLSISKRLVDLMDGEIGFVSEPNIGSTFSFTVSFRRGESSSVDNKWDSPDPEVLQFRGRRAVIVDNRSIRAEVTRYYLKRLGVLADIASSLTSACTYISTGCLLSSAPADLAAILVDREVWDKEAGIVFNNTLKECMQNGVAEIPLNLPKVFLLATSISPEERIEIKSARLVDNVVIKPLRLNVLIAGFQEALGAGRKIQVNKKKPLVRQNLVRGKQILVVDDNMVNRRVAEGALKRYGATVTCVNSGAAAVKLLKPPHKFDACFMDRHMPEMDGLEATRKIRSMEKLINDQISSGEVSIEKFGNVAYWHTPILAMTADVIQGTNEECLKCGMDDYISKPFDEEQLYNALARFFDSG